MNLRIYLFRYIKNYLERVGEIGKFKEVDRVFNVKYNNKLCDFGYLM